MSSIAPARSGAASGPARATSESRHRRLGVTIDTALTVVLAAGFALVAFVASGGTDLGPNTWVEIALITIGAASAVAVVLLGASGRPWGVAAVIAFAVLVALTYASIAWSVQPGNSWVEANRTLSYLAAFAAGAALARVAPARWPALIGAVTTVAVVVCGYALLTKVFPATLNASDPLGRLRAPFDYWNATGLMAALGLPGCLWVGTRPGRGRIFRVLAIPAITLLLTALMLSFSRGGLIAAIVGLGCWFVLVPLRLRSTLLLALGAVGAAIATLWALAHHALTHDYAALPSRTTAGHEFGMVLLVVLILMTLVGVGAAYATNAIKFSSPVRRRIGMGLVVLLAMVPLLAIVGLAASSRGLTGEISHAWSTLTSPNSHVNNNPGRLAELGNSRPLYWSEGLKVGEHALLKGVGAGGFDTARTRYSASTLNVAHAHSFVIETFADFGLIGIAITLALLVVWGLAVWRTLRVPPPPGRPSSEGAADTPAPPSAGYAAERTGLITLLAVVVIFGVSSAIDWTWFIPGLAVPALACAGWLAGRGPLDQSLGLTTARGPLDQSLGLTTARGRVASPLSTGIAAIGITAAAVLLGWVVWQPLHSNDAFNDAISAMSRGDASAALTDARDAASIDPVSVDPLWEQSAIYSALGDQVAARRELVKATSLQPDNPQTWEQLGLFDLQRHQLRLALGELEAAHRLELGSLGITQQIAQAQAGLPRS